MAWYNVSVEIGLVKTVSLITVRTHVHTTYVHKFFVYNIVKFTSARSVMRYDDIKLATVMISFCNYLVTTLENAVTL